MTTDLTVEIADLAVTILKAQTDGDGMQNEDIADNYLAIARDAVQAYEQCTGFRVNTEMLKYERRGCDCDSNSGRDRFSGRIFRFRSRPAFILLLCVQRGEYFRKRDFEIRALCP